MWANPFSSFGWPNEIPSEGLSHTERLNMAQGNITLIIYKIKKYPYRAISKATNALYKFTLMLLYVISLFYVFVINKKEILYFIGLLSISFIFCRTIFFSLNGYFETRYLVTVIPFMEVLVAFCIFNIINKNSKNFFYRKSLEYY